MSISQHWTERSVDDFVHRISNDFVVQLDKRIDDVGVTRTEVADRLGITGGAVSQALNAPGNWELKSMVRYARVLGLKVAIVAYDDDDPNNDNGPIVSELFAKCWERLGKPVDFFEFNDMKQSSKCWTMTKVRELGHEASTSSERSDIDVNVKYFAATGTSG